MEALFLLPLVVLPVLRYVVAAVGWEAVITYTLATAVLASVVGGVVMLAGAFGLVPSLLIFLILVVIFK